ncbi:MAG: DUF4167 domain-containing protein [Sphingomicrobium sp.]
MRQGTYNLINNRQGGRRRGRGGQRPQGMSGNAGSGGGNARDNRQRGNAAQLLEKYKSMARDSQLAGDRVQTEYYLQFADHYFRVLEEGRSRFEDQQQSQQSRRNRDDDDYDNDDEMSADGDGGEDDVEVEPRQQPQRRERAERTERPPQRERLDGNDRAERPERPQRHRPQQDRPNGNRRDAEEDGDERISLGVLPPAIGASEPDIEDEAPKPRRRVRKPRVDGDGEDIAPAA